TGLGRVDELRRDNERARFFGLPELFRAGQARALDLARQYAGTPVEPEAKRTAEACAAALGELVTDDRSGAEGRLAGVLEALTGAGAQHLVDHVREALGSVTGPGGRN